jgi:hypothetical protein
MFEEKGEEELSAETQLWKIKEWKLTELQMSKIWFIQLINIGQS